MSATVTTPEKKAPGASTPDASLIDPGTLRQWMEQGTAVVVDVREPEEFAREHIAGARLVPLSRFDPGAVPVGKTVVLHCKSGRRSAEAAARLGGAGVYQLKGGIDAWKGAGLPVASNPKVPISIMRQVQIVAGSMVALGTVLGASVSAWFLVIPAFVGLGLTFAGLTGTCGLAAVLGAMPWNKAFRGMGASCSPSRCN